MDKKSGVKLSKLRFLYYGLMVLLSCLALWLCFSEGKRLHFVEMEIMPSAQKFIINVEADGGNVQVFAAEDDVYVRVSYVEKLEDQRMRLTVEGNIREKAPGSGPVHLLLLGFDHKEEWNWEILSGVGLSSIEPGKVEMVNVRSYAYVIIIFEILFLFLPLKNNRKKRSYAREKLLELVEEAENQAAFEAGKRWFLIHDRRRYWNRCLELFLICGLGIYFLQEYIYQWVFLDSTDGIGLILTLVLAIMSLRYSLEFYWTKKYMAVLLKENRPLTAAFAFLTEAAYGFYWRRSYYKNQIHNAAVGLARAGRHVQALELADYDWKGVREKKLLQLVHSGLIQVCFEQMGREEDAEAEFVYQKQFIKKHPLLKKVGEAGLLLTEIRNAYVTRKFGQAEAYVNVYCERYPDAYHRIGVMLIEMRVYEQAGEMEKAKDVCDSLLSYSPENAPVRDAMRYGVCTYRESPDFLKDKMGFGIRMVITGMAVIYAVLGGMMLLWTSHLRAGETGVYEETKAENPMPQINGTKKAEDETVSTEQPETGQEPALQTPASKAPGFEVDLPKDWNDLAVRKEFEGGCSYHQKKSYDLMGDGVLFYIQSYSDGSYVNLPDYEVWGYDGPYVYAASRPTDVAFYTEDSAIMEEYRKMESEISQIRETFRIQSDTAKYDGYEFVFPNSSNSLLKEPDLWNLSASHLRVARNEIYARHGRRFHDEELQRYFNQCSWYEGTIDPEDFDERMLSEIEQSNIRLIQEQQQNME
ncbi:MAG: YARHG domain-containing protein [Lacrimispora sp.]|uniref:YARHG domain-containing protein n=1 Tax=Lacrimispora sp. TaxID=2719234 RepID=UPI0039E37749